MRREECSERKLRTRQWSRRIGLAQARARLPPSQVRVRSPFPGMLGHVAQAQNQKGEGRLRRDSPLPNITVVSR